MLSCTRDYHSNQKFRLRLRVDPFGTQGYHYLLSNDFYGHTAFYTKEGLDEYLATTGLIIGPKRWEGNGGAAEFEIFGEYTDNMMLVCEETWQQMLTSGKYIPARWLSNGQYTLALVEVREGGNAVHYLNPNCHFRPVFAYEHR